MPQDTNDAEIELVPFCAHRASPGAEYNAVVLRYVETEGVMKVVAEGKIGTTDKEEPYFRAGGSSPPLRIGDRVVYDYPVQENKGLLKGTLDNAAGMAACLQAALTIKEIAEKAQVDFQSLGISFIFSDEEEGPADSNATFSRGARRYLRRISRFPETMTNVDGHDVRGLEEFGRGALYASFASDTKGVVVPPQLYVPFRNFMKGLEENAIKTTPTELAGRVSRSDDVAMMEVSPNVLILGYGTGDPHFNKAIPTANLSDLVDLSRAIVWTALSFQPSSTH